MSSPNLSGKVFLVVALACLLAVPCVADSQARVVRLSVVDGDVLIDRNTGQGYEKAFLNLPVTEGVKIKTGRDGRAELEFEDASTLRMTPNSVIDVPELWLRDSGAKVSTVHLQEGAAYVSFLAAKGDEFNLTFAREKLTLTRPAHVRIEMGDTDATVAVFKGDVEVAGPSGTVEVGKNQTASFDLLDNERSKLARSVAESPFDSWDKQQSQYQQRYSASNYSSYSPYAYGTNDLSYYGNFFSAPGYGMLWQPYFAGAGWDPYMNGAWAFYPGFGYGWVSAYPWGWTPYHYGSWVYVPLYGWAWQPGGAWMGWNTVPVVVNAPAAFIAPHSPGLPGQRILPVNRGPAIAVMGRSVGKVGIPNNSAGLGIPRGSVRNLSQLSQTAEQRGFATTRINSAPAAVSSGSRGGHAAPSPRAAPAWHGSSSMSTSSGHSGVSRSSPVHR